ncbi:MAG: hypothetical protein RRY25_00925 [Anaerovorax sp.]
MCINEYRYCNVKKYAYKLMIAELQGSVKHGIWQSRRISFQGALTEGALYDKF